MYGGVMGYKLWNVKPSFTLLVKGHRAMYASKGVMLVLNQEVYTFPHSESFRPLNSYFHITEF